MVLGTPLRQRQGVLTGHVLLGERTWEMSLAGVWLGTSAAMGPECEVWAGPLWGSGL